MDSIFKYTLAALMITVALFQCIQVVARYIFHFPLPGLEEILLFPTLWLYLLGSAYASKTDTQISANVLDIFLKTDKAKLRLKCVSLLCSTAIVYWLTYWGFDLERYIRKTWKTTPILYFPMYFAEVAMVVGLVLMSIFTTYHLIKAYKQLLCMPCANKEHSA